MTETQTPDFEQAEEELQETETDVQTDNELEPETAEPPVQGDEADWQSLLTAAEEAEVEPADPVVQLVHEYKDAVKARDEWQDKYLRAAAEFANAKRRAELRASNDIWAAQGRILSNILPVLDDFERAFGAVPEDEQDSTWVEGFALIQRKLQGVLDREGITEIKAEGQSFDPNLHQAVIMEEAEDVESGTVLDVLQTGYQLGERVLRPSMVKVAA